EAARAHGVARGVREDLRARDRAHGARLPDRPPERPGRHPLASGTVTPVVERYLAALVRILDERLGDGVVGAYLHGSAVLGGWHPQLSDVDVLAVCAASVDAHTLHGLAGALSIRSLPCPVERGLEFGLVTAGS